MLKLKKTVVYDAMHKTVATGLIGFTFIGTAYIMFAGVRWYFTKRPVRKAEWAKIQEEKLSIEQSEREAELMQQQQEAERI